MPWLEDYGQTATYLGNIDAYPHAFALGVGRVFINGQTVPVDGNTAKVLSGTRYSSAFRVSEPKEHRGRFEAPASSLIGHAAFTAAPAAEAAGGDEDGQGGGGSGSCCSTTTGKPKSCCS